MQDYKLKQRIQKNIKWISALMMIGLFFFGKTFAQNDVDSVVVGILNFLSRGWVLFASLAGKLMTNDFVYGEFIHLDKYLWNIRNIMKNFANYAIGFIFLVYVIQTIVKKEADDIGGFIKKKVLFLLIAGIGVQASRFLFGALLDISTIATSAIGAFPSQFIASDSSFKTEVTKLGSTIYKKRFIVKKTIETQETKMEADDLKKLYDAITPKYDSVAGPLVFIGASIFNFQNFSTENIGTDPGRWTLSVFVRVVVIGLFTVSMLLLFVLNVIRVAYLWIFIAFSPVLILVWSIGNGTKKMEGLPDWLSIEEAVKLVFQPLIFIAKISIMLIFIVSINAVMKGSVGTDQKLGATTISNYENRQVLSDGNNSLTTKGSILPSIGEATQNTISILIVYLAALFILWSLVKDSTGTGIGKDIFKKITDGIGSLASNLPIIPLGGGTSLKAMKDNMGGFSDKFLGKDGMLPINASGQFKDSMKNEARIQKDLQRMMGIQTSWGSNDDGEELNDIIKTRPRRKYNDNNIDNDAFFNKIKEQAGKYELSYSTISPYIQEYLAAVNADNGSRLATMGFGGTFSKDKWEEWLKLENINTIARGKGFKTNGDILYDYIGGNKLPSNKSPGRRPGNDPTFFSDLVFKGKNKE